MRYVVGLTAAITSLMSASLHAQALVAANAVQETPHTQQARRPLAGMDTRITVDMTRLPLADALQMIARQGDVPIALAEPVLSLKRTVTLSLRDTPVEKAFHAVLQGTDVTMTQSPSGQLMFARAGGRGMATQGTIVGRVLHSKTKVPIAGATITLDAEAKGVTTGDEGAFRLNAPTGDRTLHIRALGMAKQTQKVIVAEGGTVTVEVVLEPNANVLNEVVVTGTIVATERRAIPNPITVFTAEDIEKRGITRVEELFRGEVPGMVAQDLGSDVYGALNPDAMVNSIIFTRGASSLGQGRSENSINPPKTYVDGVEMVNSSYLGTIDPKSIERIEVIVGPQAATVYGSGAQSGVIQIFTKKGSGGRTSEVTLSLKYGILQNSLSPGKTPAHNDVLSVQGGTGPAFSYSGNVSYNYTGQWQPALFNRRFGAQVGMTHSRGVFVATGSVGVTKGKNGTTYGRPRIDAGLKEGEFIPLQFTPSGIVSHSASQNVSFSADHRSRTWWQQRMTVGINLNQFDLIPTAPRFQTPIDTLYRVRNMNGQRTSVGYNTTFVLPPNRAVSSNLTLGITGSTGSQLRAQGCAASEASASWVACGGYGDSYNPYAEAVNVTKPIDDQSWGGFGQWQIGFFNHLFLTLGLRGEKNPDFGLSHAIDWTPTNGATYAMEVGDVTIKLRGSYGRATRPPRPEERLEVVSVNPALEPAFIITQFANPFLTPSYSRGPQGGFEIYYGNRGTLTINRYVQQVSSIIQAAYVDSVWRTVVSSGSQRWELQWQNVNSASLRQHGWEGTGAWNAGPISLQGTWSWNDSRVKQRHPRQRYSSGNQPGEAVIGMPTHTGNLMVGYASGKTSITLNTNFIGRYIDNSLTGPLRTAVRIEPRESRLVMYIANLKAGAVDGPVPRYHKSNLAMSHRLTTSASLTVNVVNLGNSFVRDGNWAFPALGRQTMIGASFRFPK